MITSKLSCLKTKRKKKLLRYRLDLKQGKVLYINFRLYSIKECLEPSYSNVDVAIITPFYDFVKQIHCVKIGLHFLYNTICSLFLFESETGSLEEEKKKPCGDLKKKKNLFD